MRLLSHLPAFFLLLHLPLSLAYTPLSDHSLTHLAPSLSIHTSSLVPDHDFDPVHGALLAPILRPRVPGTEGHARVQEHFAAFVRAHLHPSWRVEWHNTTATTPATGSEPVPFRNLILRRDPPWRTPAQAGGPGKGEGHVARLTLAAHYDSLYRPEGFVGAVDSAVPCALLLYVARAVDAALTRKWEGRTVEDAALEDEDEVDKGVQILLLDGEEAWVKWTDEDSLYGSRALAEAWENTAYEPGSRFSTPLEAISLFVLLDLLGAPQPTIPSYFPKTHWAYRSLGSVEARLRKLGLLETKPRTPFLADSAKESVQFQGYVLDDHIPFMKRGVDVLHVIPTPFPAVWHTMQDDGEHLDLPTIRDWARIMTGFVAEWMDLEGYLPEPETGPTSGTGEKDEL
ncbi:hypothetical protein VTJ83DRAFT_230 [Remersonia thermophila]|uniref:Peptide hydrolase n=1 Tax=Remersonia thermophila TaxID=72144 RepID=A0ABR4DLG9_9PEZI